MKRHNPTRQLDLDPQGDLINPGMDPNDEAASLLFVDRLKKVWPGLHPTAKAHFRQFAGKQPNLEYERQAEMVLDFLNTKRPGKHGFRHVESNLKMIRARLAEGITIDELRAIVAIKARAVDRGQWPALYLRPETLFNATKCNSYLGELGAKDE